MKMYGKMLKRLFGAVAVCVALGSINLKATFEQDLINICKWGEEDPDAEDVFKVRKTYEGLYREFRVKIGKECQTLREREGFVLSKAKDDYKKVFCPPTGDEAYLPIFGYKLWECVLTYEKKLKDLEFKSSSSVAEFCRFVFTRRMCGLVQHCIRYFSGRFGSKELFDEKDYDLNKKTMAEILKPYLGEDWYCEGSAKGTFFQFFLRFKEGLGKKLIFMGSRFSPFPYEDMKEVERLERVDKACLGALSACYSGMVNGLWHLCNKISESFQEYYSACARFQKEDFSVFLKRTEGNLEGILEMRKSITKSDEEKNRNAEIILGGLLSKKNAACDRLEKKTEELKALEGKFDLVSCCSEPYDLRMKLAKICRGTTKGIQSGGEYKEIQEKLREQDVYRTKLEALRKEVREAEGEVIRFKGEVEDRRKDVLLMLSEGDNLEERKFVEYALHIAKCDAFLKSFFYLHTLFGNAVRECASKIMEMHAKENKIFGVFGRLGLDKVVLTNDFDGE